jgi:DNA-binding IclR family transcriptional regulator
MEKLAPHVSDVVDRLKAVFLEIPGTRLTLADAAKLSGLERPFCHVVLLTLEDAGFLKRGRDGLYRRRTTDSPDA